MKNDLQKTDLKNSETLNLSVIYGPRETSGRSSVEAMLRQFHRARVLHEFAMDDMFVEEAENYVSEKGGINNLPGWRIEIKDPKVYPDMMDSEIVRDVKIEAIKFHSQTQNYFK